MLGLAQLLVLMFVLGGLVLGASVRLLVLVFVLGGPARPVEAARCSARPGGR